MVESVPVRSKVNGEGRLQKVLTIRVLSTYEVGVKISRGASTKPDCRTDS